MESRGFTAIGARVAVVLAALTAGSCVQERSGALDREGIFTPAGGARATKPLGGDGGVWFDEREPMPMPPEVAHADEAATTGVEPDLALGPRPPAEPDFYRVKSGDVLVIDVLGETDMRREVKVGPDGRISYYIANGVKASGRTFAEIRADIAAKLRQHFRDPEISISGHSFEGNTVSILGQVAKPGRYEIRNDTRLLDAIAQAGGIPLSWTPGTEGWRGEDVADLEHAYVLRGSRFLDVDFVALMKGAEDAVVRNNVVLRPDDRIYIPPAVGIDQRIIVLGEVGRPGVVRYSKRITFLEAVAEAGGLKTGAWERRSFVVRGRLTSPAVIPIDLRAVMTGQTKDVRLEAGDIVLVPKTALAKVHEITGQILPLLESVNRGQDIGR